MVSHRVEVAEPLGDGQGRAKGGGGNGTQIKVNIETNVRCVTNVMCLFLCSKINSVTIISNSFFCDYLSVQITY